ncbi:myelin-associated glyco -like protein [Labeo rohita]|uniref:Myelin-associated glyco-like protein n=1 Tax=Labeo rohita TaxID=84645 RepID=A0A498NPE4_LABRO|nr:myelin-associated glyco -like protein [Labeo rohita]
MLMRELLRSSGEEENHDLHEPPARKPRRDQASSSLDSIFDEIADEQAPVSLNRAQSTVSFLIILTLILVLFALTVGLGLYKMRQSMKLKAQNEAADIYASLQLSAPPSEYETLNISRGCHCFSFWAGAAVGATVVILCGILCIFARRKRWPRPRRDRDPGLVLTDRNIPQISTAGDESDPVYANTAMLSPNGAATKKRKEPLYYASIDFTKMPPPESDEIRGVSSLTKDYTVVRCYPGGVSEEESSTGSDQPNSSVSAVMKSEEN